MPPIQLDPIHLVDGLDPEARDAARGPRHPLRLDAAPEPLPALWRQCLQEIESNWLAGPSGCFFAAGGRGQGWNGKVFTRDLAYAGVLGLNALYPEQMRESLRVTRAVRDAVAWRCPRGFVIRDFPQLPVVETGMETKAFARHYRYSSPLNKTDDVVWLWAAGDLLDRSDADREDWRWLWETGLHCFERYYDPLYDHDDGLFHGAMTFADPGHNGYPESFGFHGNCLRMDEEAEHARNQALTIKATCTNALYVIAMQVMADAAERLDLLAEAQGWRKRRSALIAAMRDQLRFEDGGFACFKHRHGQLEPRRSALGSCLPVLAGVVTGAEARAALAGHPVEQRGVPTLHPFYANDRFYHNNSTWPFASTLFLIAAEAATGSSQLRANWQCLRQAYTDEGFWEVVDWRDGRPRGKAAQLWTCAAFVNACQRAGFVDLDPGSAYLPSTRHDADAFVWF